MTHPYIYKKRGGIQVAKIAQNEGANAILAAEHTLKKAPQTELFTLKSEVQNVVANG